jgi:hypothetical protein
MQIFLLVTLRVLVGAVGGGYGKRDSATNGLPKLLGFGMDEDESGIDPDMLQRGQQISCASNYNLTSVLANPRFGPHRPISDPFAAVLHFYRCLSVPPPPPLPLTT